MFYLWSIEYLFWILSIDFPIQVTVSFAPSENSKSQIHLKSVILTLFENQMKIIAVAWQW